jgi:hypothetical protein
MLKAKTGKDRHRSRNTEEAIEELTKEDLTGFHMQVPKTLHTAFKIKAASNGETMKSAVLRMILKYVQK